MSWCDVTLRRSRPEGSAKGRAELTPQRKRDRALLQCLSAQCLMIDDHANFTSLPICARTWLTNTSILYVERKHESAGCCQVARRPGGASHRDREREKPGPESPAPRKAKKAREGSALQDRVCLLAPGPRNGGRIAVCCAQGRESFPNFHCCVCSSAGRLQTPLPSLSPPPLFFCPRILRGRPPPTDGGSGPGQLAVCFQRGPPGR